MFRRINVTWIDVSNNNLSHLLLHFFFIKFDPHSFGSLCFLSSKCFNFMFVDSYYSNFILYINNEVQSLASNHWLIGVRIKSWAIWVSTLSLIATNYACNNFKFVVTSSTSNHHINPRNYNHHLHLLLYHSQAIILLTFLLVTTSSNQSSLLASLFLPWSYLNLFTCIHSNFGNLQTLHSFTVAIYLFE